MTFVSEHGCQRLIKNNRSIAVEKVHRVTTAIPLMLKLAATCNTISMNESPSDGRRIHCLLDQNLEKVWNVMTKVIGFIEMDDFYSGLWWCILAAVYHTKEMMHLFGWTLLSNIKRPLCHFAD